MSKLDKWMLCYPNEVSPAVFEGPAVEDVEKGDRVAWGTGRGFMRHDGSDAVATFLVTVGGASGEKIRALGDGVINRTEE